MRIEVWSDVVCPWCYIGKRNLEAALRSFEHADAVEVVWRSYELDPTGPRQRSGSYVERIARKYGIDVGAARASMARMVSAGAEAGVDLRFETLRAGNTFDAHRLLHHAREVGVQHELKERLFAATFTEGEPIGDPDTLVRLAADVGIAPDDARRALEEGRFADAVRADEAEAEDVGVQGVPYFVVDRRFAVPGAQAPDVFLRVLDRAWDAS